MGDYKYTDEVTAGRLSRGEGFTPEEGLELLRTFQSIPRRSDRTAALEIVKRIAEQAVLDDDVTVITKKPRVV